METFGSLCDKLSIVKLKQWHSDDKGKRTDLKEQEGRLIVEMDNYLADAISGTIPKEQLTFASNKVARIDTTIVLPNTIGGLIMFLAETNCELWHEQEKVYDFENVPVDEKNTVIKSLAMLNLTRCKCIDWIDKLLSEKVRT